MTEDKIPIIDALQLREGMPAITTAFGSALVEAIAICLQNHR